MMNCTKTTFIHGALGASIFAAALLAAPRFGWCQVEEQDDAADGVRELSGERIESDRESSDEPRPSRDAPRDRERAARDAYDEREDSGPNARRADDRQRFRDDFDARQPRVNPSGSAGDRRYSGRRASRDSQPAADASFRAADFRAPDLGIWFKRASGNLLIIDDLSRSGAIAQFGFLEGDRIVSVNGQRATSEREFVNLLLADEVLDDRIPVVVIRDSRRQLIYVRPAVFVAQIAAAPIDPLERLGVVLDDRYVDRIVVWRVLPRSPAFYAGLRPGDEIKVFDEQRIDDAGDLVRRIGLAEAGDVAIEISRNQRAQKLYLDLSVAVLAVPESELRPAAARNETFDDIRPDPYSDRRLSPRPDVPPGMRVPGGEVGRERGPIAPSGYQGGTPTTPMRPGFPR